MTTRLRTLATAALAATLLAGCGMNANSLMGADDGSARAVQSLGSEAARSWHLGAGHAGSPAAMFRGAARKIGITPEQRGQLKEIARRHLSRRPSEDLALHRQALEELLLADSVDAGVLRDFVSARTDEAAEKMAGQVDTLAEMRAVLTAEQRQKLVALLSEPHAPEKARKHVEGKARARLEAFRAELNLTPDQAASLDALKQKLAGGLEAARPELKDALVAFVQTGDKAALAETLSRNLRERVPTEDIVKVATALSKKQREKIVRHFDGRRSGAGRHRHRVR